MYWNQYPIRIISRPKLFGFGNHWGVQLPNGDVAHHTPLGERMVSYREFAQGLPVEEIRKAPYERYEAVLQRVRQSTQCPGPYRLGDRNCENYANWLLGDKPESPQVNGWATVGAIVGIVALLNRSG